jgi:predicted unusual protein kinase regulating ubiquinone biosynthesis (AarF/ABC1/UbiB family)
VGPLLLNGTIHSDPHPGNFLLLPDGMVLLARPSCPRPQGTDQLSLFPRASSPAP